MKRALLIGTSALISLAYLESNSSLAKPHTAQHEHHVKVASNKHEHKIVTEKHLKKMVKKISEEHINKIVKSMQEKHGIPSNSGHKKIEHVAEKKHVEVAPHHGVEIENHGAQTHKLSIKERANLLKNSERFKEVPKAPTLERATPEQLKKVEQMRKKLNVENNEGTHKKTILDEIKGNKVFQKQREKNIEIEHLVKPATLHHEEKVGKTSELIHEPIHEKQTALEHEPIVKESIPQVERKKVPAEKPNKVKEEVIQHEIAEVVHHAAHEKPSLPEHEQKAIHKETLNKIMGQLKEILNFF